MSQLDEEKATLRRILEGLAELGWRVSSVDDGEESIPVSTIEQAVEESSAVEVADLWLVRGAATTAMTLVWGNSPEELCADMTTGHHFDEDFDKVYASIFPEEVVSVSKEIRFTVTAHYDGILPNSTELAELMEGALEHMRQESTLTNGAPDHSCNWVKVVPQ